MEMDDEVTRRGVREEKGGAGEGEGRVERRKSVEERRRWRQSKDKERRKEVKGDSRLQWPL